MKTMLAAAALAAALALLASPAHAQARVALDATVPEVQCAPRDQVRESAVYVGCRTSGGRQAAGDPRLSGITNCRDAARYIVGTPAYAGFRNALIAAVPTYFIGTEVFNLEGSEAGAYAVGVGVMYGMLTTADRYDQRGQMRRYCEAVGLTRFLTEAARGRPS